MSPVTSLRDQLLVQCVSLSVAPLPEYETVLNWTVVQRHCVLQPHTVSSSMCLASASLAEAVSTGRQS